METSCKEKQWFFVSSHKTMNSTKESSHGNKFTFEDYGLGMGLSFGSIITIVIIVCASWKCFFHMRAASGRSGGINRTGAAAAASTTTAEGSCAGLDEATLVALPKLLYSEAKKPEDHQKRDSIASGCSICLADYKDNHMLRQLPYCGHFFHVDCVDPWLRLQATCPICRDSPFFTGIHQEQHQ